MPGEDALPVIDEARIKRVFDELAKMEVELDPDPLEYGPKRLNNKVAQARGLLTRCERIFLQVSHDLQLYKRTHRSEQLDFDLQAQDLYANDPEVRAGRNVKDREALATMKLRDQRETLMNLEVSIQDLEMVMSVVKAKRADLRDVQGRIRDQIKLCQEEIGLGATWRSRLPPGVQAPDLDAAPKTDPEALAALQELAEGADDGEVHLSENDSAWLDGGGDETDVDDLLNDLGDGDDAVDAADDGDGDEEREVESDAGGEDADGEDDGEESDAESDDDGEESEVERAWDGKDFDEFPKLGYCSVCGEPSHETPSGSMCKNGHGGADWTDEPPEPESEPEPEPEPESEPEPEPEPEPESEPEATVEEDGGSDLVDDLFSDDGEGDSGSKVPPVKSDAEVDDFFDQIDAPPAKTKKADQKPDPNVADDDIDDLIGMFSDS